MDLNRLNLSCFHRSSRPKKSGSHSTQAWPWFSTKSTILKEGNFFLNKSMIIYRNQYLTRFSAMTLRYWFWQTVINLLLHLNNFSFLQNRWFCWKSGSSLSTMGAAFFRAAEHDELRNSRFPFENDHFWRKTEIILWQVARFPLRKRWLSDEKTHVLL